jgi:hypothetical protein
MFGTSQVLFDTLNERMITTTVLISYKVVDDDVSCPAKPLCLKGRGESQSVQKGILGNCANDAPCKMVPWQKYESGRRQGHYAKLYGVSCRKGKRVRVQGFLGNPDS